MKYAMVRSEASAGLDAQASTVAGNRRHRHNASPKRGRGLSTLALAGLLLVWPAVSPQLVQTSAAADATDAEAESVDEVLSLKSEGGTLSGSSIVVEKVGQDGNDVYTLDAGDHLTIRFLGYPELSGEYRVRPNGAIAVPMIGQISVSHMTVETVENILTTKMSKLAGRSVPSSVELVEYRPIFVTGNVSKPAAYPWQPGITTLHAITYAGGIYRPGAIGGTLQSAERESLRLKRVSRDLLRTLSVMSRLEAERDGKTDLTVPERMLQLSGQAEVDLLIQEQRQALATRVEAQQALIEALKSRRELSERELAALKQQKSRLSAQLKLREDDLNSQLGLKKKGLAKNDRILEARVQLTELEDRAVGVDVSITRVDGVLTATIRELASSEQTYRIKLDDEIARNEGEVAQLEYELEDARMLFRQLQGARGVEGAAEDVKISYEIARRVNGEMRVFVGDQFTNLMPGDIVNVVSN